MMFSRYFTILKDRLKRCVNVVVIASAVPFNI